MCKIYIQESVKPVGQPQGMMNHNMREIVKDDLQKFLNVNFIYLI